MLVYISPHRNNKANMELLIILFTGLLSYSNGANDISKGIATLVEGGVSSLQSGLLLGSLTKVRGTQ